MINYFICYHRDKPGKVLFSSHVIDDNDTVDYMAVMPVQRMRTEYQPFCVPELHLTSVCSMGKGAQVGMKYLNILIRVIITITVLELIWYYVGSTVGLNTVNVSLQMVLCCIIAYFNARAFHNTIYGSGVE